MLNIFVLFLIFLSMKNFRTFIQKVYKTTTSLIDNVIDSICSWKVTVNYLTKYFLSSHSLWTFSGKVGLNVALSMVTSRYGRKTVWRSMSTGAKDTRVGVLG